MNFDYNENLDFDEDDSKKKKILIIVAILVIVIMAIFAIYKIFFDNKEEVVETNEPAVVNTMQSSINGYQVLGKIVIKDLNIEQYILNSTEEKALDSGVGKLYGGSLNSYGNFCIAGHNKENIFERLSELKVSDEFTIVDKNLEETTYEIKEIYSVEPEDLKCLIQDENKIEITLITCETAATKRLIIKAEEKNNNIENDTNATNTNSDAKENV